jgi:hypothetical protein
MRAAGGALWRGLTFPRACYYLAAAALVTSALGVLIGHRWVFPALDCLAIIPVWAWVRRGRRLQATAFTLAFWAVCKAIAVAALTVAWPERAGNAIAFGGDYVRGMLIWLRSGYDLAGVGAVISFRWKETLALGGLSLVSGGLGGLVVADLLLNCQGYYLGVLLTRVTEPWRVVVFGWSVWEWLRALGWLNLLLAAAEPIQARILGVPPLWREARDTILIGLILLAAAYVAQAYLGPWWRDALAPYVAFELGSGF